MKISLIVATLVIGSIAINAKMESIYDGTGSLINSDERKIWGGYRDEADMQIHKDKTSTVTFQVLKNELKCTHVDIHSDVDMGQDVIIRMKSWSDKEVKETYRVKLPVAKWNSSDGVSLKLNNLWTTISITSTNPVSKITPIYAYCKGPMDSLNSNALYSTSLSMALLENNHYHLGNGSIISQIIKDNGKKGYGTKHDLAVTSNTLDAETSFQVLSDKKECSEITLNNVNSSNSFSNADIESILIKGWSSSTWKQTKCNKLPCTLNTFFNKDGKSTYMLINVKTKAGQNGRLYASCGKETDEFSLNEKDTSKKGHPNSCKFEDLNHDWSDKYITALCSAGILEGYGHTGYTKFGPNNSTLWQELAKVVNLADNFYKTKDIRAKYPSSPWETAYLDIATKQGYTYSGDKKVTRGLAFQYVVDVFWHKKLSEDEATTFLQNKKVISKRDLENYLTRAEMAKVVLNSARYSGDDMGIERKLPYSNNEDTKLIDNIKVEKNMPNSTFEKPNKNDTTKKKNDILNKNQENALKYNTFSGKLDTKETDNTDLTKKLLGNIKKEFNTASAEEVENKLEETEKTTPVDNSSKLDKNKIYFGEDKKTGKKTMFSTDNQGNAIVEVNKKNSQGESKKVVIKRNKSEIEKMINIESKANVDEIRKEHSDD